MIAFGPIPSRRLGRSVGINNIPPKNCTFNCIYCQVGISKKLPVDRSAFYPKEQIIDDVRTKVLETQRAGESIDYLSFVPDGEPTLDVNLGEEIDALKSPGIGIAVITNGSLLGRADVRSDLSGADLVSVKVDSADTDAWRRINRPSSRLNHDEIKEGALEFARSFTGRLLTETMLVDGVNDGEREIAKTAEFVSRLNPQVAYLSVPTRPPAVKRVRPSSEESINRAFQQFKAVFDRTELLISYEGNTFVSTGDFGEDLLGITAVHPMKEAAVLELARKSGSDWTAVQALIDGNKLIEVEYRDEKFYLRKTR